LVNRERYGQLTRREAKLPKSGEKSKRGGKHFTQGEQNCIKHLQFMIGRGKRKEETGITEGGDEKDLAEKKRKRR